MVVLGLRNSIWLRFRRVIQRNSAHCSQDAPRQWCRDEFARVAPAFLLLSCPSTFFGCTSTISRFFDDQYSLVSFLFAVSTHGAPGAQPSIKVETRAPVPHGVDATSP